MSEVTTVPAGAAIPLPQTPSPLTADRGIRVTILEILNSDW